MTNQGPTLEQHFDWLGEAEDAMAPEMIARSMVTPVFRPGSQAQYADTATPTRTTPTVNDSNSPWRQPSPTSERRRPRRGRRLST